MKHLCCLFLLAILLPACSGSQPAALATPAGEGPHPAATTRAAPLQQTLTVPDAAATATAPLPPSRSAPDMALLAETLRRVASAAAGGDTSVAVYLDARTDGLGRWLVHTSGPLGDEPGAAHRLYIYSYDGGAFRLEAAVPLAGVVRLAADSTTITADGAAQWIALQAEGHSGERCFLLFRLTAAPAPSVAHCHPDWASRGLQDLDGDGLAHELQLNESLEDALCATCGLRQAAVALLAWNGEQWQRRRLLHLPDSGPEPLRSANTRALALAEAGLWDSAAAALAGLPMDDESVRWNSVIIDLQRAALREQLTNSPYPLLSYVYLGDYDGALALLRPYPPAQVFAADTPLVAGTAIEGYVNSLATEIVRVTARVIAAQAVAPEADLAAAYFLQAWVLFLSDGEDILTAEAALARADGLAPGDPLIADSLFYFYNDLRYRP